MLSLPTLAAGLPPWQFGMSKSVVTGFTEFGPYKDFKNGDAETFSGFFDGNKEDIQFFFDATGLYRIGIYMYEGQDVKKATAAWQKAYESLRRSYGEIETPDLKLAPANAPVSSGILAAAAGANTEANGKTQMAPVRQPAGMFVFSSFSRHEVEGMTFYYVVVYLEPHP